MKKLQKWDTRLQSYLPYEVPDDWRVSAYELDMGAVVNCARCGRRVVFGDTYSSMQIHTEHGFAYAVCAGCHEAEWREEKREVSAE